MSWTKEFARLKTEAAKPPHNAQSIEEIAAEIPTTNLDRALQFVNQLIKEGRAERVNGKKLSATGALVPAIYYRLLATPAKQPKKK